MSNGKKPGTGATNKRRRELAAAKLERQTARREARAQTAKRRRIIGWSVFGAVAIAVVLGAVLWPFGEDPDTSASPTPTASESPSGNVDIGCAEAPLPPDGDAEVQSWKTAPEIQLAEGTQYQLRLDTNCGAIVINTLPEEAPNNVNSVLWLAQQGFYDATPCHRLTTEGLFVLQCGDPFGTGGGNAGYTVQDENLPDDEPNNYPRGTVAMANSGENTNSSQFFIAYQDTTLPPSYTIWGTVSEGMEILDKVAAAGVVNGKTDGEPAGAIGIVTAVPDPRLG